MSIENPNSGLSQAASRFTDRYVAGAIRVESFISRGLYWLAVLVALIPLAWSGLIINQVRQNGNWREGLLYTAILLAIAAGIYLLGWGWRWLWSGRVDHLFGSKKYGAPGKLEDTRQKIASVFVFIP